MLFAMCTILIVVMSRKNLESKTKEKIIKPVLFKKEKQRIALYTDKMDYEEAENFRKSVVRDWQKGVHVLNAKKPFVGVNKMKLSFGGLCSKYYTEPPSTKRDLLLFSFKEGDDEFFRRTNLTLSTIRPVMPNVSVKIFTFGPLSERTKKLFASVNAEILDNGDKYQDYAIVNSRFFVCYDYLSSHRNEFDRIIFSDIKDIIFFNDPFLGVSASKLRLTAECFNLANSFCLNHNIIDPWTRRFYDPQTVRWFNQNNFKYLNAGTLHGGIGPMIEFLKKFIARFERRFIRDWGYDQTLLNIEYYRGNLNVDGLYAKGLDHTTVFWHIEVSKVFLGKNE